MVDRLFNLSRVVLCDVLLNLVRDAVVLGDSRFNNLLLSTEVAKLHMIMNVCADCVAQLLIVVVAATLSFKESFTASEFSATPFPRQPNPY